MSGASRLPDDRCPVCQARFRGARTCSRCGADLTRPMLLAAEAWRLRDAARAAVAAGEFALGSELAVRAQEAKRTGAGEALRALSEWLGGSPDSFRSAPQSYDELSSS